HRGMGGDLLVLRAYYEGLSSSYAGTGLGRKARWLSIDCLELSGDCKAAIAEYQALRSVGGEDGVSAALRMGEVYLYGLRDRETAGKVFEQILSEAPESEAASLASDHLAELGDLSQLVPEPLSEPGAAKVSAPCPEEITLSSNWPNPFNPRTVITFALPEPAFVKLEVYNILGQRVSIPAEGLRQAGTHSVSWDGKDASGMEMASGVYFYRLVVDKGRFVQAKKMLLIR
ncbi:MAG: FlgD immunoglobulin-like domain containing protein, partial [Candidatus Latescibacterota bacterium]